LLEVDRGFLTELLGIRRLHEREADLMLIKYGLIVLKHSEQRAV